MSSFGSQGFNLGQFNSPTGIGFTSDGRISIADRNNLRVQACDDQGQCARFGGPEPPFGFTRRLAGVFDLPFGVEVDSRNRIIIADEDNHWVQSCDSSGCLIAGERAGLRIEPSQSLGQFAFPDDAAVDAYDRIWVADSGNRSVMSVDIASGGLFDTATEIDHCSDGTITLTFEDCNSATVEYDIPSVDRQGTVPIQRIAHDNIILCDAMGDSP